MMNRILLMALSIAAAAVSYAQNQPPVAENEQNEIVTIDAPPTGDDGVLAILRSGDKMETNHYISRVVELKHALAMELEPHVRKAVDLEKGATRVMRYKSSENEAEWRYFIQVVTTERQMPSVIETIEALDHPGVKSDPGNLDLSIRMRYRRASEIADILANSNLSGLGKVFPDDVTNTLFMDDSQSDNKTNMEIVDFFDVPPLLVELDVQIVEIRNDDAGRLGLDWDAWKSNLSGEIAVTSLWLESHDIENRMDSILALDAQTLSQFLNFTVQSGTAKLISRAKVTANNLTAGEIGYKQPLGGQVDSLSVKIQPLIGMEMVTADIDIQASRHSGFDEKGEPLIDEQNFHSIVTIRDHQSLHLGTIKRQAEVNYRREIPILRKLPVLGRFFGVSGRRTENSRLFIVATPCFCNSVEYAKRTRRDEGDILRLRKGGPHHSGK